MTKDSSKHAMRAEQSGSSDPGCLARWRSGISSYFRDIIAKSIFWLPDFTSFTVRLSSL